MPLLGSLSPTFLVNIKDIGLKLKLGPILMKYPELECFFRLFASRLWKRRILTYQGYFKVIYHHN